MLEIAKKRRIYNSIGVRPGLIIYDLRAENDYSVKGKTLCGCVEFQDGNMSNFPIAALGGAYGLNGREHRSDRKSLELNPQITKMITQVQVFAGNCPTGGILKKIGKEALKIGWTNLRAYAAMKGVILPEDPPN